MSPRFCFELLHRPAEGEHGEIVVGRDRRPAPAVLGANRGLEPYARQIAPVGVVHRQLRAPLVVLLGLNRLCDEGVFAVGADHYSGALGDALASLCVPANAGHDSIVGEDLLDREALAELDAGLDRGVDQQLVEHRAPRAVSVRDPVDRLRRTGDRQRPEVERVGRHRWASGLLESLQQTPALERSQARWMHVVRRHRVARKGRLVDHQHPVAPAGKEHRRRRSCAARPHDDRVIPLDAHGLSSFVFSEPLTGCALLQACAGDAGQRSAACYPRGVARAPTRGL